MTQANNKTIMVMAGGTGGHIFPGLAIADKMSQQQMNIVWLGTQQGMESHIIPAHGYQIEYIEISGLRKKGLSALIYLPYKLIKSMTQAYQIIKRIKPDLVVGMGGYVSGPAGVVTWLMRKPLLIHEQNSRAGLTNKLLNIIATKTLCAFPNVIKDFYRQSTIDITGNPIRQEIIDLSIKTKPDDTEELSLNILVLGGSLGAQQLNLVVPKAIIALVESDKNEYKQINIKHQTGKNKQTSKDESSINIETDFTDKPSIHYEQVEFIDDMAQAYAWADVAICRAGALTISELTIANLPAILVPYPYAVDDHQTANAMHIVENKGGYLITDAQLTPENLVESLLKFKPENLKIMQKSMLAIAKPQATQDVFNYCLALLGITPKTMEKQQYA